MKKSIGKIALLSLAAVLFLGISTACASSKPKIDSFSKKTSSSVKIKILYDKYASTKVDIVVSVLNKDSGGTFQKTFKSEKLDSSGYKTVQITKLNSKTKYSFKVKIKKHSSGSYSSWSSSSSTTTKS